MTHFLLLQSLTRSTNQMGFGSSESAFQASSAILEDHILLKRPSSVIPRKLRRLARSRFSVRRRRRFKVRPIILRVQSARNNYAISLRTSAGKTLLLCRGGYGKRPRVSRYSKEVSVSSLITRLGRVRRRPIYVELIAGDRKLYHSLIRQVAHSQKFRRFTFISPIPHNGVRTRAPRRK